MGRDGKEATNQAIGVVKVGYIAGKMNAERQRRTEERADINEAAEMEFRFHGLKPTRMSRRPRPNNRYLSLLNAMVGAKSRKQRATCPATATPSLVRFNWISLENKTTKICPKDVRGLQVDSHHPRHWVR